MNKPTLFSLTLVSGLVLGGLTAYWFVKQQIQPMSQEVAVTEKIEQQAKPLFYRNPMNPDITSPMPAKDNMGMDYIPVYADNKMDTSSLQQIIKKDLDAGKKPFLVVANAGDVSTGVVDNLEAIAAICKSNELWFHIDGAYGVPAAIIPELKELFLGLTEADSIALDPHKWLYSPLEAGSILLLR